jgi:2-aminoadipate transaminase
MEALLAGVEPLTWSRRFARRAQGVTGSVIRELLKLTEQPEIISFAGGLPAPEAFPLEAVERACRSVIERNGVAALQYGPTEGYLPLRELILQQLAPSGIAATTDNVLVTTGSQQGLDLVGKLFLDPGDSIATEQPTYLGALQAFRAYQPEFVPLPIDAQGVRTEPLEAALRLGPKLLYVQPNFQNPSGATLGRERRQRLVEMAGRHGVPIVEDDPYGQLRYEGQPLPSLARIDAEMRAGGAGRTPEDSGVLYLGTLSKTLGPGLRIGWVVGPAAVLRKLAHLKQGADLQTSTFTQMVAWETARAGFLDVHLQRVRALYRERRDAMLRALAEHFPGEVRWTRPQGGLFLWVTLPPELDSDELLARALQRNVAFVPGAPFFTGPGGAACLRLNFSYGGPATIEEGVARLGVVLREALAGRHASPAFSLAGAR